MGFLDNIGKVIKMAGQIASENSGPKSMDKAPESQPSQEKIVKEIAEDIVLASSSRTAEEDDYGDDDSEYLISFKINDAFKEAQSHAAEVLMLHTYAPAKEYGEEGAFPCLAIMLDDAVYNAVNEFKEKGTISGAIEITPLSGKFYFKAKMEYHKNMMYFYGMDRLDGFWQNNGLCIIYQKEYVGTENERKLMAVLDEAAESYSEERKA